MQNEERADILSTTADSVVEGELVDEGMAEAIRRMRACGMAKKDRWGHTFAFRWPERLLHILSANRSWPRLTSATVTCRHDIGTRALAARLSETTLVKGIRDLRQVLIRLPAMSVDTPTGDGIYPFEADLPLVIASKMAFVSDGGDFLFLRKGEAAGALEVAVYAARLLDPDIVGAGQFIAATGAKAAAVVGGVVAINKAWEVALKHFETFVTNASGTKDLIMRTLQKVRPERQQPDRPANERLPRDMRILCSRTPENELAIPLLTAMGARIRHRPADVSSGTHRFHVNRSRFVLHFRLPGDRFLGVTGSNPVIRERLRAEFLDEWERCAPDVKA